MKSVRFLQAAAVTISSAGLILPQSSVMAAAPQGQPAARAQADSDAPAVLDVTLTNGGVLRGQVVDVQGQPAAEAPVAVYHQGKQIATTKTLADGSFAVSGLRGGTHVVTSGDNGGICRMWAPGSAPPSAQQGIMIVRGGQTARGQGFTSGAGLLMLGALGGIVAGGIISQDSGDNGNGSGS